MQVRFLKRLSGKTPREQNSSGKKIGAVWCSGADRRSFEASAVPILVYLCIVLIVHKYRQSAKERFLLKRNTVPEVFPLTAILAGSGKTKPFEKRRSRYKETAENKAGRHGKNVHPCTFLSTCLQSKHATDVNDRRPWRFWYGEDFQKRLRMPLV